MADEDKKVIDEDAIKAEAHTEATEKIAEDVKSKKDAVETSIKDVLTGAGLDAEFTQKEDKLVVEIPLSNQEEKDALVAKMVAEKMKQAEEEAAAKAAEEVARRQAEIEAAAREKAEAEARERAEAEARAKAEAEEAAKKAAEEEAARKAAEEAALEAKKQAEAEEKARKAEEAAAAKKEEEARKAAEKAEKARIAAEKQAALEAEKAKKAEEEKANKAALAAAVEAKKKAQEETRKRNSELAAKAKAEKKAAPKKEVASDKFIPNFKRLYLEKVRPELQKEFNYSSPMQIPRLTKITVSVGCGDAVANKKYLDAAVKELEQITGQHVLRTKARKAIANFKIRQGMEIGAMVTLRGDNMWYFLERLISIALPRVRDFRGVKKTSFDGRGNYSLGITEQIIFPEIDFDKIERVSGLNVAIVTTAESDKEGYALLKALGMPFVR